MVPVTDLSGALQRLLGAAARQVLGRSKRSKLAHGFLREHRGKRLTLAQLLSRHSASSLSLADAAAAELEVVRVAEVQILGAPGWGRARSHRRFARPLIIRFIPDCLLSKVLYSVPLYLKRQCDRTLGAVRRRALGLAVRPDVSLPARARARGRLRGDADENNGAHHSPARSSGVPFKDSCRSVAVSAFGKRSGNTTA